MIDDRIVGRVRRFNRAVGETIGAVDDRFLGRRRPIGESRLLWEIGADGAEVRTLRARLGLDSGYVARVLRSLERQGLVRVRAASNDRRVRIASLTRKGIRERTELDRRSDALAARILEPLTGAQRAEMVEAMSRVEQMLRASMVRFDVEPATTRDARWCLRQYFSELNERFDRGFHPDASLPADAADLAPPRGAFVVARRRREPVGCGALMFHADRTASLRRMWVARSMRGLGLGAQLLDELERLARERGATRIRLETNRALREAIALYRRSGYVEVPPFNGEPYAHHWFEKPLARR